LGEDVSTEIRSKKASVAPTLEKPIELFINQYIKKNQKPSTRIETKRLLLTKWKPLHQLTANEVTRNLVAEQLAIIEVDASAITRNRARAALSRLFTWAIEEGLAENNAVVGTAKAP